MVKKLFAVTNVNHDGELIEVGAPLDQDKFTKDQLKALYDAGAVEIRESGEEKQPEVAKPNTDVEQNPNDDTVVVNPKGATDAPKK